jgi:hypothetical protein
MHCDNVSSLRRPQVPANRLDRRQLEFPGGDN